MTFTDLQVIKQTHNFSRVLNKKNEFINKKPEILKRKKSRYIYLQEAFMQKYFSCLSAIKEFSFTNFVDRFLQIFVQYLRL